MLGYCGHAQQVTKLSTMSYLKFGMALYVVKNILIPCRIPNMNTSQSIAIHS